MTGEHIAYSCFYVRQRDRTPVYRLGNFSLYSEELLKVLVGEIRIFITRSHFGILRGIIRSMPSLCRRLNARCHPLESVQTCAFNVG